MIPAAQHAAFKALKAGVDEAIRLTQDEALEEAARTGADRWRTPYGTVSVAARKDAVEVVDERALLDYVREHAPTELVEQVRDSFRKALLARLTLAGDQVVDATTGEVVPWAGVKPGGQDYLSVRDAGDAKQAAVEMVLGHLDEVAGFARPAGEIQGGEDR